MANYLLDIVILPTAALVAVLVLRFRDEHFAHVQEEEPEEASDQVGV